MQYTYDPGAAEKPIRFIERFCRHAKGRHAGNPFLLEPWQKDLIRTAFGWLRPDATRRYRTIYLELPRGNGKSTLAAALALYLTYADGEPGAEVVSIASNRAQAGIVFDGAKQFVESEPALLRRSEVYKNAIVVPKTNSSYKVLSSDAPGAHGLNLHGAVADELHTLPNRDLWDAVSTSMVKRDQPMLIGVTTAGIFDKESLCWQLHDYAKQVEEGIIEDETFLPCIFAAEKGDDIEDPATWAKANPNLGVSVSPEYLKTESVKAKKLPRYFNVFCQLHLNVWAEQATRWLPVDAWNECQRRIPDLTGKPCYGGLDLSTTTDLAALVLAFPVRDTTYLLPFFWLPEARLTDKRDGPAYDLWARQGHLRTTEGEVIDYEAIRRDINELGEKYSIQELAVDPWNSTHLATQLQEQDGFQLVQVRQGYVSMNAPSKEFERRILNRSIIHGGNPVLDWCVSNAAIKTDPAGNIKPAKDKATGRIDGVVAAIMAIGRTMVEKKVSVYAKGGRGLLSIQKDEHPAL